MQPQHALEGEKNIFVRFRHGLRLYIKNNIREELRKAVDALRKNPNHAAVFKELIQDIKDGSGRGIHPDSTWISAVKEIFDNYERDRQTIQAETKDAVIEILDMLTKANRIEDNWEKIQKYIIENIDILSGWKRLQEYRGHSFFGDIKRDKNGRYYMIENKKRIEVIGAKTQQEERFDYIVNDAISKYGRIGNILHLISLIAIGEQYKSHPEHFSKGTICNLPDSDWETYCLHWSWYTLAVYNFIPVFWKPRSCFCDPQWLAFDLLAKFSQQHETLKDFPPQLEGKTDVEKFNEAFKGYGTQYELALQTDLYLGEETDVYFEFEDRKIRWINGTRFVLPTLVIPCNDSDYKDARTIAKKFLSVVVKEAHIAVVELFSAGGKVQFNPLIRQPRAMGGLGIDPRYLIPQDVQDYSNKKWIGLALYKEGANSQSIYYSFLSFYKILELAFKGDTTKVMDWIDANIDKATRFKPEWKNDALKPNQKAGKYLYGSCRCAVAHIESEKGKTNNPDDLEDFARIQRDLPIMREFSDEIFTQNIL